MSDAFVLYKSFYKPLSHLSDEQLGRLLRSIFRLQIEGDAQVESDILIAFEFIKNQLDIDKVKWEKKAARNKQNGLKGGAPKGNNNASKDSEKQPKTTQNNPKQPKTTQNKHNENENENENVLKEKDKKEKTDKRFSPPQIEEVRNYISEKGYNVDAEAFISYYTSVGWMIGNRKMRDWRMAVVTWQKREVKNKAPSRAQPIVNCNSEWV